MIGKTVSHYRILEKLDEGGMGVVYVAEDTQLGRRVALKFLPADLTQDLDARERFKREARAASSLDHASICTIYEVDETADGQLYIAMAFYDGETLKTRLAEGPLEIEQAVDIARQVASGLARAHEHKIVHRDIKPANLMITGHGEAKILDFGIAKLTGEAGLTRTGASIGTLAYMAPEQADASEVGPGADLWALGVVLYEMIAGRSPFARAREMETLAAIMAVDPEPIIEVRPDTPPGLATLVDELLAKDPDHRPASAAVVTQRLAQMSAPESRGRLAIQEIHRRSLWQVFVIFLAGSWIVHQVVEVMTEAGWLPNWTPAMALILLVIGLVVSLATAFVQEGIRGKRSDRFLTWRKAILGGVGGVTLLGVGVVAYFVMWATGIGPVGNLVAQGTIEAGARVVLADLADATDEGYADAITEALRIDLLEASVLDLVEAAEIAPTLRLMQVEPGAELTAERALEVAKRDGIPAVIDGEVRSLGTGYLLSATLRATEDGRSLAAFRVTADSPDELIRSTDQLSQDLRAKSGESLRTIRAGKPLEQVTTNSLEALKIYTEALKVSVRRKTTGAALSYSNRRSPRIRHSRWRGEC